MARPALIESLRRQAARDAQAVWDGARAEAERRRAELATTLEQERLRLDQAVVAEVQRVESQGAAVSQEPQHLDLLRSAGRFVTITGPQKRVLSFH